MSGSENIAPDAEVFEAPVSEDPFQTAEADAMSEFEAESAEVVEDETPPMVEPDEAPEEMESVDAAPEDEPEVQEEPEGGTEEEIDFSNDPRVKEFLEQRKAETDKYLHKRAREIAEKERQLDALMLSLKAQQDASPQTGPEADGPPQRPGENATQSDWDQYTTDMIAYQVNQATKPLNEKINTLEGGTVQARQQAHLMAISQEISGYEGYAPEVDERMTAIANADDTGYWHKQVWESPQGRRALFDMAKGQITAEQATATAAAKETETVKRQQSAASRATPRPASVPRAAPENKFDRRSLKGMTRKEKMELAEQEAANDFRS